MFVRAENIERTLMVGGLTVATALLAGLMLYVSGSGLSSGTLFGIAMLSITGFVAGRLIDYYMGPSDNVADPGRHSLGGDFAD